MKTLLSTEHIHIYTVGYELKHYFVNFEEQKVFYYVCFII